MTGPAFEANSTLMRSMVVAMTSLGHLERIKAAASPALKELIDRPLLNKWWPGTLLDEMLRLLGPAASRAVNVHASSHGMLPLAKPFIGVLLSLSKSPMLALLAKVDTFVGFAVRGVRTEVIPHENGHSATVSFVFPGPVHTEVAEVWYALLNEGFGMAKMGRIAKETLMPQRHQFDLEW